MRKNIFWTSFAFTVLGIVNLILFIVLSNLGYVGVRNMAYLFAIGVIAAFWVPMVLNLIFKIKFSLTLLICYDVFCFLSIAFASLWGGYHMVPYLDKILHGASGVLFALLIYEIFANGKKNQLSLFWIFVLTFSFAMMCGGFWEIFEYSTDALFGNDAQVSAGLVGRAALYDTMGDLIADFIGSVLGGAVAVWMQWRKNKSSLQEKVKEEGKLQEKAETKPAEKEEKLSQTNNSVKQENLQNSKKEASKTQKTKEKSLKETETKQYETIDTEKQKLLKKMKNERK